MRFIKAKNASEAWRKTFLDIYDNAPETWEGDMFYFKDEAMIIELETSEIGPDDELFPMSPEDLRIINDYMRSGKNEDKVIHEWTKLYYHRIFDEPNSQAKYFIEELKSQLEDGVPKGPALISLWDKNIDQGQEVSPCTKTIWGRIKDGKLDLHINAHSSDAYKKLLMNIAEFVSFHQYVAEQVGVPVGRFVHQIDSCHLHNSDKEYFEDLAKKLKHKT